MKYWHLDAVKIACFLENGLGTSYTYQDALSCSNFVKVTLKNIGQTISCQYFISVGIEIDINNNTSSITCS